MYSDKKADQELLEHEGEREDKLKGKGETFGVYGNVCYLDFDMVSRMYVYAEINQIVSYAHIHTHLHFTVIN